MNLFDEVEPRKTILSPCRMYRYRLWREWNQGNGYVMIVGLNPSTADETKDDNTIRKCVKFAKTWGYQALCMTNLFAFRATQPSDMIAAPEPIGAENNQHLLEIAQDAGLILVAWGAMGGYMHRDRQVIELLKGKSLKCLGLTQGGLPKHPLYIPDAQLPFDFQSQVDAIR